MPKDKRRKNHKIKDKNRSALPDSNFSTGNVEVQTDAVDMMVGQDIDMAKEDGQSDGITNGPVEEAEDEESHLLDTNKKVDSSPRNIKKECAVDYASEQLVQTVMELTFQNEFFKAQFDILQDYALASVKTSNAVKEKGEDENSLENVKELQEKIKSLTRELQEQKEMQIASDNALKHLQMAHSEADTKTRELSAKLSEAQQKMDVEIKQRDDKYVELDSKFGRLLKRAKQRIQELQKEKDDLEIRFQDVNEATEKASSQQSAMQQEIERTRQNANEALRSMDVERQQLRAANNKYNFPLVGTPGRPLDHLSNTKGFSLRLLKYLVLDEADRLLDMDFEKDINEILKVIPRERKTYLFSATMTQKVHKLKRACLHNPVKVEASSKYSTVDTLIQQFCLVPAKHKDCYLAYILREMSKSTSSMVFTCTCEATRLLGLTLQNLGLKAIHISGQMSQEKRLIALNKFKSGECNVLICTDVASRGLDIPSVDMVINYGIPVVTKDYIHRVGRTARAGRSGVAISLVNQFEVEWFLQIENLIGKKLSEFPCQEKKVLR